MHLDAKQLPKHIGYLDHQIIQEGNTFNIQLDSRCEVATKVACARRAGAAAAAHTCLMIWRVACMMPVYSLLFCTVRRPLTMSRGYVALMPMIPAHAPQPSRSNGVICPSPPFSSKWCDTRLHSNSAVRLLQSELLFHSGVCHASTQCRT